MSGQNQQSYKLLYRFKAPNSKVLHSFVFFPEIGQVSNKIFARVPLVH